MAAEIAGLRAVMNAAGMEIGEHQNIPNVAGVVAEST